MRYTQEIEQQRWEIDNLMEMKGETEPTAELNERTLLDDYKRWYVLGLKVALDWILGLEDDIYFGMPNAGGTRDEIVYQGRRSE